MGCAASTHSVAGVVETGNPPVQSDGGAYGKTGAPSHNTAAKMGTEKRAPKPLPPNHEAIVATAKKAQNMKTSKEKQRAKGPCTTDPAVTPGREELMRQCCVPDVPTRSEISVEPVEGIHANWKNAFDRARDECMAAVDKIVAACEESGKPFFDPSFYYDRKENTYGPDYIDDNTVGTLSKIRRLWDIYGQSEDVEVFTWTEGQYVSAADMVQGDIGSCFYVGAVASIAAHEKKTDRKIERLELEGKTEEAEKVEYHDPIFKLFVNWSREWGVYGLMYYKMSRWRWLIVDDLVPVREGDENSPQFARARDDAPELWPTLIEKLYAKIYTTWKFLDGGCCRKATATLTGGVLLKDLKLDGEHKTYKWSKFKSIARSPFHVVTCVTTENVVEEEGAGEGRCGEGLAAQGLVICHVYSVLDAYDDPETKIKLVKLRNPWGNDGEWTGPWSDSSAEWKEHPHIAEAVHFTPEPDGTFWMNWKDYKVLLGSVAVIRHFPLDWQVLTLGSRMNDDEWSEQTFIFRVGDTHTDCKTMPCVFVVGQPDSALAPVLKGGDLDKLDSETKTRIQFDRAWEEWTCGSLFVGIEVRFLGKKMPKDKQAVSWRQVGKLIPNGENRSCTVEEAAVAAEKIQKGYYAIHVDYLAHGQTVNARVMCPFGPDVSLWLLSKGRESALGYKEFEVEEYGDEEEEWEDEEGEEWDDDDFAEYEEE